MNGLPSESLRFAEGVRLIGRAARAAGLTVPSFRAPCGVEGADRSIRRAPTGRITVSMNVRGRPMREVYADIVEGVIAANDLDDDDAARCFGALMDAVPGADA